MPDTNDSDFIPYPAGYIIGVIDQTEDADRAVTALRGAGFDDDGALLRLTGEAGARRIDANGDDHGLLARLIRFIEYTDDSRLHAEEYEREALAGHVVVGVHAPDDEALERARALLKTNRAHFINHYGKHGLTETLDP